MPIVAAPTSVPGNLMKSPFAFQQHGACGRWVSEVFPHLAGCVDDMAFLMALASKTNVHGPGSYMMNTGFLMPGFPCLGAWVSYGLGSLTDDLPTFVVLPDSRGFAPNGPANWGPAFLPAQHQGTMVRAGDPNPIHDLFPPQSDFLTKDGEADGLRLLNALNREHASTREGDSRLDARIASYELAARLQEQQAALGGDPRDAFAVALAGYAQSVTGPVDADAVRAAGTQVTVHADDEAAFMRGYWGGITIQPDALTGARTAFVNSRVEGV